MIKNSDYPRAQAIITSAGRSSRMGQPKALLPFSGQETFIGHITAIYTRCQIETLVVTNQDLSPLLKPIIDQNGALLADRADSGWHMIDSLRYGLKSLPERNVPLLIQPVDMPFISADLLNNLLDYANLEPDSFIIPKTQIGTGHPLLIPYQSRSWLFSQTADNGLQNALLALAKQPLTIDWPDERIACNLNRPEDFKKYFG